MQHDPQEQPLSVAECSGRLIAVEARIAEIDERVRSDAERRARLILHRAELKIMLSEFQRAKQHPMRLAADGD